MVNYALMSFNILYCILYLLTISNEVHEKLTLLFRSFEHHQFWIK